MLRAADPRPRTASGPLQTEPGPQAAILWWIAGGFLAALPVLATVANRSSTFAVTAAAAAALAGVLIEERGPAFLADIRTALRSPLGLVVVAFLGWSSLSLAWSADVRLSLTALGELLLPTAAGLVLALTLPARLPRLAVWLFAVAVGVSCIMIVAELWTGLALRKALGMRSDYFIFKRSLVVIVALVLPLLACLRARGAWTAGPAIWGAVLVGMTGGAAFVGRSGSALLGLLLGVPVLALTAWLPRVMLAAAAAACVAAFTLAPLTGDIVGRTVPEALQEPLEGAHSRERLDIWRSFGAAIRERPWLGVGFGLSRDMTRTSAAERVAPSYRTLLASGHPHNAAVQVWAELGPVGALLVLAGLLLTLRALAAAPEHLPLTLSAFTIALAIWLVSHGAWQGWWVAVVAAAVVWFRVADASPLRSPGAGDSVSDAAGRPRHPKRPAGAGP